MIVERDGRWELAAHPRMKASIVRDWGDAESFVLSDAFPHVSIEEAREAFAWTFPPIHDEADVESEYLNIRCRCGEFIYTGEIEGTDPLVFTCRCCNLKWELSISVRAVDDTRQ